MAFTSQPDAQFHTKWSQPFYSCASAVKASVKTVQFELKGAASISNLDILGVKTSNVTIPTWAIEDTGWNVEDINLLWGIVSAREAADPGISGFRQPELYLPEGAVRLDSTWSVVWDAVAGIVAPLSGLENLYENLLNPTNSISGFASGPDYSGDSNWPLLLEWSRLGRNASTAGRIVDLIWTDSMANQLVGSKSTLSKNGATSVLRPAAQYLSVVAYDWKYAAIALGFAALYLVMLIASLLFLVFERCNFTLLRFYLDQTAAGRSVTTERFQARSGVDVGKNKDWASVRGDEIVRAGRKDANGTSSHLSRLISKENDRA